MPHFTHFLVLLLSLASSHKISLVAAVASESPVQDKSSSTVFEYVGAEHAHSVPRNAERSFLQVRSLHSESEANPDGNARLSSDQFSFTPTSSHPVAWPDEESEPPSGSAPTDAYASTVAASKTVPLDSQSQGVDDDDRPASPFDHYHVLGTRPGSSDSTLEKRRMCPAQPLPSNRGCKCANQTLCKIRNHRTCVQLNHDHENCGRCSLRCGTTQYCQGGKCHCNRPNFSVCGKSCYNLRNNEEHCGKCGVVCGRGKSCIRGTCKRA